MSSLAISLPCSSHCECTYHKYGNALLSSDVHSGKNQAAVNTTIIGTIANSTSTLTTKTDKTTEYGRLSGWTPAETKYKIAPIQTLPTELILSTLDYLTTTERACLALTCKRFATIIGPSVWPLTSKVKGATWRKLDEFLDVLQRDLDGEYWRCRDCVLFHPRTKFVSTQRPTASTLNRNMVLKSLFRAKKSDEESRLRLGIKGDPLYTLSAPLVKSIMERHFHSPPHGICLNALKCRGTRTFPLSTITNVILEYDYTSKIVLDRLLLRSTYAFRLQRTMFVNNVDLREKSLDELLVSLPFQICEHEKIGSFFTLYYPVYAPAKRRCSYCPTQWVSRLVTTHEVRFSVYHNLGEGRSDEDTKWKYMAQPRGKRKKIYPWGKEDIEQAFERILCSTMEEFKKQLEKSDGLGTWYDPTLARRAYKTLPESVGLAL